MSKVRTVSKGALAQITSALVPVAPAAPVVQPAAPAPAAVALRGGIAVASVAIRAGAVYRTKAVHNQAWWASIVSACAAGPAPVAALVAVAPAGPGVPTHFVGYCLRRGYLVDGGAQPVAQAPAA